MNIKDLFKDYFVILTCVGVCLLLAVVAFVLILFNLIVGILFTFFGIPFIIMFISHLGDE